MNTRRMNRLEELGRVDAEKAFTKKGARNLRDEKKRIVRELKQTGGKVKDPADKRPIARRKRTMADAQRPKARQGLKPVNPKTQKGLSKLPRQVRNKMGYMKKGGRVGMGKALRGGGCVR